MAVGAVPTQPATAAPVQNTAALRATGQMAAPAVAAPGPRQVVPTDKAAAAWAIGAIIVLAVIRRSFRGSVI